MNDVESKPLGTWILWLRCYRNEWYWSATLALYDNRPEIWTGNYIEGQGFGGFETRMEAIHAAYEQIPLDLVVGGGE